MTWGQLSEAIYEEYESSLGVGMDILTYEVVAAPNGLPISGQGKASINAFDIDHENKKVLLR